MDMSRRPFAHELLVIEHVPVPQLRLETIRPCELVIWEAHLNCNRVQFDTKHSQASGATLKLTWLKGNSPFLELTDAHI